MSIESVFVLAVWGACLVLIWTFPKSSAAEPEASEAPVPKCRHTSVPWPVMSGGDLVAWLCVECNEQRQEFTCPPPPKPKVLCDHDEMQELRSYDNFTVQRWCTRCGYRDRVADVPDFEFVAQPYMEGQPKPVINLRGDPYRFGTPSSLDPTDPYGGK